MLASTRAEHERAFRIILEGELSRGFACSRPRYEQSRSARARLVLGSYARDFVGMLHEGMTQREGMMLCNGDASTRRRLLCEGTMLRQGMILRKRTMLLREAMILKSDKHTSRARAGKSTARLESARLVVVSDLA